MLRALLRTRLQAMLAYYTRARSRKSRAAGIGFALLMVYALGCIAWMFYNTFSSLAQPLHGMGLDLLYFALAGLTSLALSLFGSVFMTQSQLYEAKDNELLLAMPIPPRLILFSRMGILYALNLLFAALDLIPAYCAYGLQVPLSAAAIVCFAVALLLAPLIPLTLSCLLGWAMAALSGRVRNKALFSTAFSVVFLLAYFYLISQFNTLLARLISSGLAIDTALSRALPAGYALGRAALGDPVGLVLFALWAIVPFAAVYVLLSRSFLKIAAGKRGTARRAYHETSVRVRSAQAALRGKELHRLFSSSGYLLNACFGLVMMVAAAVWLLLKRGTLLALLAEAPGLSGMLGPAAAGMLCLLESMVLVSAPSLSLEGKSLWLPLSLPLGPGEALLAKADTHFLVVAPLTAVSSILIAAILDVSGPMRLLIVAAPLCMAVFTAQLGVCTNLLLPRFDWVSETAAVKQSMSVLLSMLIGFAVVAGPALLYGLWLSKVVSGEAFTAVVSAALLLAAFGLRQYLKTGGDARLRSLG